MRIYLNNTMPWCSILKCKSGSRSKKYITPDYVRYHRFPKDELCAKIWVEACGKSNLNIKNGEIFNITFTFSFISSAL